MHAPFRTASQPESIQRWRPSGRESHRPVCNASRRRRKLTNAETEGRTGPKSRSALHLLLRRPVSSEGEGEWESTKQGEWLERGVKY